MDKAQTLLIIVAFLINISDLLIGTLSATNSGGLFLHNLTFLNEKYYQEIAPVGNAFGIIWPIIYIWNFVGIIYIVVSLFLPRSESPVNYKPTLVPKSFLLLYCVAYGTAIAWLFAFDKEILTTSFEVLLVGTVSVYMSVGISCKKIYDNLPSIEKSNQAMLWLIRIFIQNGLALSATWGTVATLINLGIVLIYKDSPDTESAQLRGILSMEDASTLMLSTLLLLAVVWFILENFMWEKYCRTIFTPFPVLIFAFTGILIKLQPIEGEAKRNFILACVGVGICGTLFLIRLGLSINYLITHPNEKDTSKVKLLS